MLGVIAKALDGGVNLVVVLAGTRVALWRQTFERALDQFDQWSPQTDGALMLRRVWIPSPSVVVATSTLPGLAQLYDAHPRLLARAMSQGRPIIVVAMKHADHVLRLTSLLDRAVALHQAQSTAPLHLLVIDDEADDGSILDAEIEKGAAPDSELLKNLPRHISRIWAAPAEPNTTKSPALFATYLAYTATPQANILQAGYNPLAPRHFLAALRTPWSHGAIGTPRSGTFGEPAGLARYYTGGEAFYRHPLPGTGLCEVYDVPPRDEGQSEASAIEAARKFEKQLLGEALRAYFVGAAARMFHSGRSLSKAISAGRMLPEAIRSLSPVPHSMLIHPSSLVADQFHFARLISAWSRGPSLGPLDAKNALHDEEGHPRFDEAGLNALLDAEPELWKAWLGHYEGTRRALAGRFENVDLPRVDVHHWPNIEHILREEVFPNVALRVINSDPNADERPEFAPAIDPDGLCGAASDLLSVFISGNVMARGVTLEGLATTLFLRQSQTPLADTQMQMQRWFGYRGAYLHLCRVFLTRGQRDLFDSYHDIDEALRDQVVAAMNEAGDGRLPSPNVLQTDRFRATGKIANLSSLPLSPGPYPFVRLIGDARDYHGNTEILARLCERHDWEDVTAAGMRRGLLCKQDLDLAAVATLLEQFRYAVHDPSPESRNNKRWKLLASALSLAPEDRPLFRPPGAIVERPEHVAPPGCPYSIAAYLRLWTTLLSRRAPGFFPTDDYSTPWSLVNLSAYAASAPRFKIGIRFGGGRLALNPVLAAKGVTVMERTFADHLLSATWGSRNPGADPGAYLGDQLFDYHLTGLAVPRGSDSQSMWRPRGHPGLLLFHVIEAEHGEATTVGLGIPLGGPDHFSAQGPARAGAIP
jgi:hypothetical protein